MHFVGKHFNAFFDYAYDHFIPNSQKPFNFIEASRLSNPVSPDLKRHLLHFVKQSGTAEEINDFVLPVVVSCILLDSFPPEMHGKFSSIPIWSSIYHQGQVLIRLRCSIFSIEVRGKKPLEDSREEREWQFIP